MRYLFLLAVLFVAACHRNPLHLSIPINATTINHSAEFSIDFGRSNGTLFVKVRTDGSRPILTAVTKYDYHECGTEGSLALCVIKGLQAYASVSVDVLCLLDCNFTIEAYVSISYQLGLREIIMVEFESDADSFLA